MVETNQLSIVTVNHRVVHKMPASLCGMNSALVVYMILFVKYFRRITLSQRDAMQSIERLHCDQIPIAFWQHLQYF
jgi:hypothetical protein